jgi:serine/threonine-protein kinase
MPLDTSDLATLSRLLEEALDLPTARVSAWLALLPEEHRHLVPRLRAMLVEHESQAHAAFMSEGPKLDDVDTVQTLARSGELVGPYRLISELGRGGMGAVWLAERADGSMQRRIALKLPRLEWGAGLEERMSRERDIVSRMEHPNIARLYDAGVDAVGRPYLAFEYVEGQPIDAWCTERALGVAERLRLFLQVARAVAYAHGRLVVHRDLKPSNVLVTSGGEVRLLDFGIAKLLDDARRGDRRLTQELGLVLTPQYASPEQIKGEAITVASDVYSLGVLLYELLTSRCPYELERSSLAAIEEAVLHGEPPKASDCAKDRQTAGSLRGEVDAILAKALKREPDLRYATADAFAEDIERHLRGDTVSARPDGVMYRLGKALWRHRMGLGAASAILAAVVTGASVSLVQTLRANEAAERARVVKEFVVDVFKVNAPGTANSAELHKLPAEMLLDRGARLIETKFAGQALLQAELYGVVGGVFADMGAPKIAAQYATKHVAVLAAIDASTVEQAQAVLVLAQAQFDSKQYRDAEAQARRAMELAETNAALKLRARIMWARALERLGRTADCERELVSAEEALRRMPRGPSVDRANAMRLRAILLRNNNRIEDAMAVLRDAIDEALAAQGPLSRIAIDLRLGLAAQLVVLFRFEESRAPREAALAALRSLGGPSEIRAAIEEAGLAMDAYENHLIGFDEARTIVERDRSLVSGSSDATPASIRARIDFILGWLVLNWGDVQQAERLISASVAELQAHTADSIGERYQLTRALAVVATMTGHHDEADALFRQLADMRKQAGHGNSVFAVVEYQGIAENLGMQGSYREAFDFLNTAPRFERADGMAADGVRTDELIDAIRARLLLDSGDPTAALKTLPAQEPPMTGLADGHRRIRGEAMCALGKPVEGLATLLSVIQFYAPQRYEFDPGIARDRSVAGMCAMAAGKRQTAEELAKMARDAFTAQPDVSPYFKAPLVRLEQALGAPRTRLSGGNRFFPLLATISNDSSQAADSETGCSAQGRKSTVAAKPTRARQRGREAGPTPASTGSAAGRRG